MAWREDVSWDKDHLPTKISILGYLDLLPSSLHGSSLPHLAPTTGFQGASFTKCMRHRHYCMRFLRTQSRGQRKKEITMTNTENFHDSEYFPGPDFPVVPERYEFYDKNQKLIQKTVGKFVLKISTVTLQLSAAVPGDRHRPGRGRCTPTPERAVRETGARGARVQRAGGAALRGVLAAPRGPRRRRLDPLPGAPLPDPHQQRVRRMPRRGAAHRQRLRRLRDPPVCHGKRAFRQIFKVRGKGRSGLPALDPPAL